MISVPFHLMVLTEIEYSRGNPFFSIPRPREKYLWFLIFLVVKMIYDVAAR